ncbi:MAG TPA: DUF2157 domain-containing protein [Actinomycetota bacterium]
MMLGVGVLAILFLVILIVAARRSHDTIPAAAGGPSIPERLSDELDRWVGAGLITRADAEALARFEARRVGGTRRGLVVEVVGYLGAILAVAGAGVAVGQAWDDLQTWQRVIVPFATAAALLVAGLVISRSEEPALGRMMSVLWLMSVASLAWGVGVAGVDVLDVWSQRMPLLVGGVSLAYAGALWWFRRWPAQQLATFVALEVTVVGAIIAPWGSEPRWAPMLGAWAVGALWLGLGWRRLLTPGWMAPLLGALALVWAPTLGAGLDWNVLFGLATAAGLMALSVPTRDVALLGIGSFGAFGYLVATAVTYFGESLGVPMTLFFSGLAILGVAVVGGRLFRLTRRPSEQT